MVMQNDGNLVIYSGNRAVWSSYTPPAPPAPAPPASGNGQSQLNGNNNLYGNQNLVAGDFRAAMQSDGVFAVYGAGTRLRWNAGVSGAGNFLAMQTDGNAVIYSAGGGSVRWQSGTSGNPGARMVMQNDGNLVIYSTGGRVLWQTNSTRPPYPGDTKNCSDFATQRAAQAEFNRYYLDYEDVFGLDENNDLVACEGNRP
jgi:hypothetical protein